MKQTNERTSKTPKWTWWYVLIILVLSRQRKVDNLGSLSVSLAFLASSRLVWDSISKTKIVGWHLRNDAQDCSPQGLTCTYIYPQKHTHSNFI